jgi:hypothetical protein
VLVAAIALLPGLFWIIGNGIGPRGPFRVMYRSRQPTMHVSSDGLEVEELTPDGRRSFAWSEIGSLDGASPLHSSRWLRAPDGTKLCQIPSNFSVVRVGRSGHKARLAELIVSTRPDM